VLPVTPGDHRIRASMAETAAADVTHGVTEVGDRLPGGPATHWRRPTSAFDIEGDPGGGPALANEAMMGMSALTTCHRGP